jgi:methyl-accepting chemotaxis protein
MNIKSINAKVWLFTAIFAALVIIQFVTQLNIQRTLSDTVHKVGELDLPVMEKVNSLKVATVQVQQWLQDISSTRAQDGLDDGFIQAEKHADNFLSIITELKTLDPENKASYEPLTPEFKEFYKFGQVMAKAYIDGGPAEGNKMMSNFDAKAEKINGMLDSLLNTTKEHVLKDINQSIKEADASKLFFFVFSAGFFALLITLLIANKRVLNKPLSGLASLIKSMADQQREKGSIEVDTSSLNTDINTELGAITYWVNDLLKAIKIKHEAEMQIASENQRIKQALDAASTNVMMADTAFNIIYMNPAVQNMMKLAEKDLQTELPNFNANNLIGQNIDVFHKNPAHQRSMLDKLKQTYRTQITVGIRTFDLIATPIFSQSNERLGTVVEWADKTAEIKHNRELEAQQKELARVATETRRIKDALDACSTNVMMADAEYNIVYMNPAVQNMMRSAEADLKKELPNFNANDLIGKNIDVFHKNPDHQRSMLARLTDTYRTTIQVGSRTFTLVATPIFDDQKNRLGTVVEWADKTAEVHIEKEVANLIKAANEGDLTKRLNTQGQTGFVNTLSTGLNELMNKVSGFVNDVGIIFEAMSEGNLTRTINNSYQGELEKIKNNANNSVAKLTEVLTKIQSASDIVRTSSNEVAQGSDDLSRRTESQASSLEETAASMEEITATVKQTAESATQSNTLASEAKLKAEKGGDVVQGAVKAMNEIMESSNKINDIIGVIDEIAFQTNLLALNAAVEAARAGEQGRGFAVVAGEVRTLSQRSAAAAKEIKDLIRDSVNKVESGSHLVNQSGQMLAEIVQAVDKVAKMIADVNTAAIEQNSGISQINQAVAQMDEMTQQNAALVEQTSAASRSMSEEANSMSRLISFFQLSRSGGFVGASANSLQEPIMTYQPVSASPAKSSSAKPAPNKGSGSAASFSSEDDWQDF